MVIATCFYGSMFSGVFSNHTDIAPNYAGKLRVYFTFIFPFFKENFLIYFSKTGLLMGITNMAATIPGFVVPALVGALIHGRVSNYLVVISS